jgi:AraC family transcriptional regulator
MEITCLMHLQKAISYIEENLQKPVSLDMISQAAGFSKFYFHRLFRTVIGCPPAQYVRKRRMTESIKTLLSGNSYTISDASCEAGYEYEQSYIRAFKSCFGITPARWMTEKQPLELTERADPGKYSEAGNDSIILPPRLVIKPDTFLYGIKKWITDSENAEHSTASGFASDFYFKEIKENTNYVYNRYIGFVSYCSRPENNMYITCGELRKKPLGVVRAGMNFISLKSGCYWEFCLITGIHPSRFTWADVNGLYENFYSARRAKILEQKAPWHLEYIDLSNARDNYGEFRLLIPVTHSCSITGI